MKTLEKSACGRAPTTSIVMCGSNRCFLLGKGKVLYKIRSIDHTIRVEWECIVEKLGGELE